LEYFSSSGPKQFVWPIIIFDIDIFSLVISFDTPSYNWAINGVMARNGCPEEPVFSFKDNSFCDPFFKNKLAICG
jgi:hypothetical protein